MAIIEDIYKLTPDFGDFERESNQQIKTLDRLQKELSDTSLSTEQLEQKNKELAKVQKDLIAVGNREAKTIDELRTKRRALSKVLGTLNRDSREAVQVRRQLAATNRELSQETARLAGQQQTLTQQLRTGTRNFRLFVGAGLSIGIVAGAVNAVNEEIRTVNENLAKTEQAFGALDAGQTDEITAKIQALSSTFGVEFNDVLAAAESISKEFGISALEAIEQVGRGFENSSGQEAREKLLEDLQEAPQLFNENTGAVSDLVQAQREQLEVTEQVQRERIKLARSLSEASNEFSVLTQQIKLTVLQGLVFFVNIIKQIPRFVKENRTELLALAGAFALLRARQIAATAATIKDNAVRLIAIARQRALNLAQKANPFGLLVAGVTAAVSAFSIYNKETSRASDLTAQLDERTKAINKEYARETNELNILFGALNEANKGRGDKKAVIDEIQSRYGDYLGNIDLEKAGQEELARAYRLASRAIIEQIVARRQAQESEEILNRIVDAQVAIQQIIGGESIEDFLKPPSDADLQASEDFLNNVSDAASELNSAQIQTDIAAQAGIGDAYARAAGQISLNSQERKQNQERVNALLSTIAAERGSLERLGADFKNLGEIIFESVQDVDVSALTGSLDQLGTSGETAAKGISSTGKAARFAAGSLAALEARLSELQKVLRENIAVTDTEALEKVTKEIDKQRALVDEARIKLEAFTKRDEASRRIARLEVSLIENDFLRKAAELRLKAQQERSKVVGGEQARARQIVLINEKLARDLEAIEKKKLEDLKKAAREADEFVISQAERRTKALLDIDVDTEERRLARRAQAIEIERNQRLANAQQTITDAQALAAEFEKINAESDAKRVALERDTQKKILETRIQALEALADLAEQEGGDFVKIRKEVEQLRLKLIELDRTEIDVNVDVDQESIDNVEASFKETFNAVLDGVEQVSNEIFNLIGNIAGGITAQFDKALNDATAALENIRANSQDFNARQLELEKERVEQLQEQRRRALEREKAIAITQTVVNSILAISKAAAEGGIAAPFTIASTIIALIAGFVAATTASQNAFFEGTEYVDKAGKYGSGRDAVPARLHRGERVVPTKVNLKYFSPLNAIQREQIPPEVLEAFTSAYLRGDLGSLIGSLTGEPLANHVSDDVDLTKELGKKSIFINQSSDGESFKRLERRLDTIADALDRLPYKMPSTQVYGDARGIFKISKQFLNRSQRTRERAK